MSTLPTTAELSERVERILAACGAAERTGELAARTPITGGSLGAAGSPPMSTAPSRSRWQAFRTWRTTPAPVRGNLVRRLGELLREHKDDLGALVSIEAGKITSEGLGEVQEMIDICEFAVGSVAPAARSDDRQRATRSPPDGDLAPDGAVRRRDRLQLPGGGVVVERRAGAGVWQPGAVEAVGQDPVDGGRLRRAVPPCRRRRRCARRSQPGAAGWRRGGRSAGGARGRRHRVGHRVDPNGSRGGARSWRAASAG